MATIVREALDCGLAPSATRRQAAARRLLDAPDMEVPDIDQLRDEHDPSR